MNFSARGAGDTNATWDIWEYNLETADNALRDIGEKSASADGIFDLASEYRLSFTQV